MDTLQEFLQNSQLGTLDIFTSSKVEPLHISGASIPIASIIVSKRFFENPTPILIIAKDFKSSELWFENLQSMVGEEYVSFFPSIGLKPYEEKLPFEGVLEERLRFFYDTQNKPIIAVCPLEAFLQKLPAPGFLDKEIIKLKIGQIIEPSSLRPWFLEHGFTEQPVVSGVGEFSIRGCILDVNCFLHPHPIRIEFFGDEIESIRTFDIFTQRSIEKLDKINIYPIGEWVPPHKELSDEKNKNYWWMRPNFQDLNYSILDYLPNCALVFQELSILSENASNFSKKCEDIYKNLKETNSQISNPSEIWWKINELSPKFIGKSTLDLTTVESDISFWHNIHYRPQDFSSTGTDAVAKQIEEFSQKGGEVYVVAPTKGAINRLKQVFEGLPITDFLVGNLTEGFWLEKEKIAFLTETRIFNRHSPKKHRKKIASSISSAMMVESLNRGDYVAHDEHGVGRYLGLVRVNVNGGLVDCALLEYGDGDRLKFPVSDLQKIERLEVSLDAPPKLDKLGGKNWDSIKKRVKKKVAQIAQELVNLYAKRELVEGFAFPPDGKLQEEFEEVFEYEPTPDQIRATADIKRDMESSHPMDRLICGDVGFGKTEVAMRAAFKCVCSKKQVAILAPTTILAAQHYENFKDRFAAFPVNIGLINRYKSPKEKREVFRDLAEGKLDIVIGTHALLNEKNKIKDLGLLIIDEEQKFGVKQKEKLREIRLAVDTISMSATPIPRSLHLSMTGVRDISLINTPPINRLPVETKLIKRDDTILAEAIKDEISRGGQVFVVHDRVHNINEIAEDVERWVPDAKVAIAHGQMDDHDLERVMNGFLSKQFDVLVSTSIIESGLDVPNANTIIINNAHHFGISQLYQMRGRVGRSDVLAKAFLVIPEHSEISSESMRRLKALEQYTDLGSGYQLAMRDLEIRGAGNLLGQEQHGFITEVGFETYIRLVKEAVEKLKGLSPDKIIQPRVELGIDAYLPEDYIEDGLTRISIYQRIARIKNKTDVENISKELADRFGPIPPPTQMLLMVTEIGLLAGALRIQGLQQKNGILVVTFTETPPPDTRVLAEISERSSCNMRYLGISPLQAVFEIGKNKSEEMVTKVLELFRSFADIPATLKKS